MGNMTHLKAEHLHNADVGAHHLPRPASLVGGKNARRTIIASAADGAQRPTVVTHGIGLIFD